MSMWGLHASVVGWRSYRCAAVRADPGSCRRDSVIMHPLPRVDEIVANEVDADPRAAYFR